ncbi:MAG: hypothetical protein H6839_06355 [Planctomycetes bacterium]|nr:hypothetical protein [Planctomycetota bacterium]
MRHRDQETVQEALEDWRELRSRVEREGGEQYDKPVLVKFLDTGTFEVMDRDIVEDEFYVLRRFKILRELDAAGKDLEQAIRDSRREAPQRSGSQGSRRGGRPRTGKTGPKSGDGKSGDGKSGGGKPNAKRGNRRGRRRGRRTGKRGPDKGGGSKPA